MRAIWTLEEWAEAIIGLPTLADPPERIVFVPNERVAHPLRRTLIVRGAPSALVGTRFLSAVQFAREILLEAGEIPFVNDHEICPALLQRIFTTVPLTKFKRDDLINLPGWDAAFVRTIADLDAALVTPEDLGTHAEPAIADLSRIHAALHKSGDWGSLGLLWQRATAVLDPSTMHRATLAVVSGFESHAEAQLLRRIPHVTWAAWGERPLRSHHLDRVARLWGTEFVEALRSAEPAREPSSALECVQARLFGERTPSAAPADDSVRVAIYAGVHDEVEATVGWVVEQLLERDTPAHEVAILSATAEPYGGLLRARLAALPWLDRPAPTWSERGVPLPERADGPRLSLLLHALLHGLSREVLAPLLPILATHTPEHRIHGFARAWETLNAVAAVGGSRGFLEGGCGWPDAWKRALARLDSTTNRPDDEHQLQRQVSAARDLAELLPAIEALSELLQRVVEEAPLRELWLSFAAFARDHVRLPPAVPPALSIIEGAVDHFIQHETIAPRGAGALAWLEDMLKRSTARGDRFGVPSVYIGTLAGARGLSFAAVRIVGLAEGSVPSAVREDPVLSDAARTELSPFLPTSRQRAHRQLAAFYSAMRAARERVALSAPRVSLEGSARQPAAVLLDVMRALQGSPNTESLERQLEAAASMGRARERRSREQHPLSVSARLERVAYGDTVLAHAERDPALSLERLRTLRDRTRPNMQDGLLRGVLPPEVLRGLAPDRPVSATRLATLLSCPHQYLLEQVLHFEAPAGPLSSHQLEVMAFGS